MNIVKNIGEEVYVFKGERLLFLGTINGFLNYIINNQTLYSIFRDYKDHKVVLGDVNLLVSNKLIDVSDRIKLFLDNTYSVIRFKDYVVAIKEK